MKHLKYFMKKENVIFTKYILLFIKVLQYKDK